MIEYDVDSELLSISLLANILSQKWDRSTQLKERRKCYLADMGLDMIIADTFANIVFKYIWINYILIPRGVKVPWSRPLKHL